MNDLDIANAFNEYFCNIAIDLDNSLPLSNIDPLRYLNFNSLTSMYLFPVDVSECMKIISSLKITKQDVNSIPVPIFKSFSACFIDVLCDIINMAFSNGIFPDSLKIAFTIPIFKKGDKFVITNFRPISLLPFMSKIFEKCLYNRLLNFLSDNQILNQNQYGFLRGKSTEDAMVDLMKHLHQSLNSKLSRVNIFIDFRKAFDTLNHNILLRKLNAYGIRGPPLKLIQNYLFNRKQFVKINNTFSSVGNITLGIPQGSVLGPLLYLIYVNDLPNLSQNYQTILFADDTVLSFEGKNPSEINRNCNLELGILNDWAIANRLTINSDKTFFNIVSNSKFPPNSFDINLNNVPISQNSSITYLGVIFDEKLKFNLHIKDICNKISKSIGVLNKLRDNVPHFALKNLYYSLIFPYLNYCNIIWGGTYFSHLNPLIILQKKAIRIINNCSYFHHTNKLFFVNRILKLSDLNKFHLLVHMYKLPDHSKFIRSHQYSTRFRTQLNPSFQRLTSTQMFIDYRGPLEWNKIPPNIKNSQSLEIFKRRLKYYFIENYDQME